MRAYVYIDGFNLYYRAVKNSPYKWLDLHKLSARILDPNDTIEKIRYFTARISSRAGDPDAPRRQQIYLSALAMIPNLQIHYGMFLTKTKKRPLTKDPNTFVEVNDTEEKGSDVNLAMHLINDGWLNCYDVALVISQDSDLIEPIKLVNKQLNKIAGLAWLDNRRPNVHMKNAASFIRHVKRSDLAACQLPDPIQRKSRPPLHKPPGW